MRWKMALEKFKPAQEQSSWTDEFEFTSSAFEISSIPIRYYLTNVRLSALEECFKLVEDIPGSASWGYNAIFQRDIDDDRVEDELLKKYLLNPNKFKFFNPLTIALLPFDAKSNQVLDKYPEDVKKKSEDGWEKEQISGIDVESLSGSTVGKIKWDQNRIIGVAIDGQHRLSALMQYAKRTPVGINPSKVRVPIVLLVFDPERGNILAQIREIFVDINKNAKPVTKARNILLNDRDIFAVFARDLIKDPDNPEGLRYEVVDWKRETARPEGKHRLTTIIVLYEIVRLMFQKRLTTLESELDLNTELSRRRLQRITTDSGIDGLSDNQIQVALKRFQLKHKKFILYIFENLSPYKLFLDKVAEYLDNPEDWAKALREYFFKPPQKREDFKKEIAQRFDVQQTIDEPMKTLEKTKRQETGAELLFLSIGQRGLFSIFYPLKRTYELGGIIGFEEIAKAYCKDLALLMKHGFFARSMKIDIHSHAFPIWQGVCLRGDRVNASGAAADRLGALILLVIAAMRFGKAEGIETETRVKLKSPFRKIQSEYEKEWFTILEDEYEQNVFEDGDEETMESDELEDDESTETDWTEENSIDIEKEATRRAKDTIYEILKRVLQWSKE
jgi:DGQHR domain-containing protein